jgi:hypothetical protein
MPRPKPNKLHDELDALLDGRPVELTDELAPLAEAADALRAELAAYQLDPGVADRHLERVLHGSATVVPLPVRGQPNGWDLRRRLAAVVLAAALVLVPATMASAAALPGQPMYPFKRAIEELRIASVQWSPSREATERTRVADARLGELNRLFTLKIFTQVPTAITALSKAVQQAEDAVDDATREGEPVPTSVASKLSSVKAAGGQALVVAKAMASQSILPAGTRNAINAAVVETQTQGVLVPPGRDTGSGAPSGSTPTPPQAPADPASGPSTPGSQTQPSVTTPVNPTTTDSPVTTTTTPPTTTTEPEPSTTDSTVTPGSAGGGGDTGGGQTGADGRTGGDAAPTEQAPADVPSP